jgi:hypothetical protein
MAGMLPARRSRLLAGLSLRAAARAWSCSKRFTVPPSRFSLLATERVTGELRASTGDAAMEKAKSRVVNKDAKGNMIEKRSNLRMIRDLPALYMRWIHRHYVVKVSTWLISSSGRCALHRTRPLT